MTKRSCSEVGGSLSISSTFRKSIVVTCGLGIEERLPLTRSTSRSRTNWRKLFERLWRTSGRTGNQFNLQLREKRSTSFLSSAIETLQADGDHCLIRRLRRRERPINTATLCRASTLLHAALLLRYFDLGRDNFCSICLAVQSRSLLAATKCILSVGSAF